MAIYFLQDSLLFFPDKRDFNSCPYLGRFNAQAQVLKEGGEEIRFYLRPKEQAKGWVIHFHGNAGAACDRSFLFEALKDLPINIILAEYPGYSDHKGKLSEKSFLNNARALLNYIKSENKMDLPLFLFGESLGTGVSIKMAGEFSIKGLILQSPYTSIAAVGQKAYPFLPVKWMAKNKFSSDKWAPEVKSDVIIFHGVLDQIIPISFGKKLSTYFPQKVEFHEFPDREHNDMVGENPEYWKYVEKFLTDRF